MNCVTVKACWKKGMKCKKSLKEARYRNNNAELPHKNLQLDDITVLYLTVCLEEGDYCLQLTNKKHVQSRTVKFLCMNPMEDTS